MNDSAPSLAPSPESAPLVADDLPTQIGRYRVEKLLGQGGFGLVYLARDDELKRLVAIKVPHRGLVASPEDADEYLAEARIVASLDHPHIVPVYDVGRSDPFLCFVVSKFIDGLSLAARLQQSRPSLQESLELVATVAETLHYAHGQRLVHRDIKPSNILLDKSGQPFVTDFGLALREQDVGGGPRYAGTPDYMSPEQARGEGHRVDGRSDIFSLGVVLYELLTGRRPFAADSPAALLEQIANQEARPPRQWDDTIPKEAERICLKALAKRFTERYTIAKDLADDLRQFLDDATTAEKSAVTGRQRSEPARETLAAGATTTVARDNGQPARIVPKGLRSFDEHDADFFLELLPGTRGRDGLPDSLRFWKTRAEATDPSDTFTVGLLYGPSGCGKSSLLKAGLLPRLSPQVIAVQLEATADETETRLLHGLLKKCLDLPRDLSLKDSLAAVRQGRGLAAGQKLLIVIDQFEQWLHAKRGEPNTELVQALRQCDGARVQCIVLVRDDFWMAATRFLHELDIRLVEGQNSAAVDLFPPAHARKVLEAFGRAYGTLLEADPFATDPDVQQLVTRVARLPPQLAPLRTAVEEAIAYAEEKPGWALISVRSVLEYVVREVFERRIATKKAGGAPPPLENVLQQLGKAGFFPGQLDANADFIKEKGNRGAHDLGPFSSADVRQSLAQLPPILDWYFTAERPQQLDGAANAPPAAPRRSRLRLSEEQSEFLDQAVAGLAQEGKVICVRLALFAEMMKSRQWTPATLKEVGGAEGIGVTFLDDTFSSSLAPPRHRIHQKGAQAVLKALLPEAWTDIKGHMRSRDELLASSSYSSRPQEFGELLGILDNELRLITPTDPEGLQIGDDAPPVEPGGAKFYQLTHDYLVPSIREWLVRKQKESRQGRAELRLAIWSSVWNAKPERRNLPSWWEWAAIRLLTRQKDWTGPQQKMMRVANRYHLIRGLATIVLVAVATFTGLRIRASVVEKQNETKADDLVQALLKADTTKVPSLIADMKDVRPWAVPLMAAANHEAADGSGEKLNTCLALMPDADQVAYLKAQLLEAKPHDLAVIREALRPYHADLTSQLWAIARQPPAGKDSQRLRAAAALALFDPYSQKWADIQAAVADDLAAVPAVYAGDWTNLLLPVAPNLLPQLALVYRDPQRPYNERSLATDILSDYAAANPPLLADLLMDGDESQFAALFPQVGAERGSAVPTLLEELDKQLSSDPNAVANERLAKRQANAAVALLRLGEARSMWPLLRHPAQPQVAALGLSDPRARSYLVHRLAALGADPVVLAKRFAEEPELSARRALLLSLGEFKTDAIPAETRQTLLQTLQTLYADESDAGLHAAAQWLLRQWGEADWLGKTISGWAADPAGRAKRLAEIQQALAAPGVQPAAPVAPASAASPLARWYVNSQGQTMVVIPGPATFVMGSPPDEPKRNVDETQHKVRIGRTFALASTAVTVRQYQDYRQQLHDTYTIDKKLSQFPDQPAGSISWYMAAEYCNWLSKIEDIPDSQCCFSGTDNAITLKPNYLSLGGYRLPTEAEMEYATRAGAPTSRYYGQTEELLPKYAWYLSDADEVTHPVASLKPNDFGLFDMQGNVRTWCQERYQPYPQGPDVYDDTEDTSPVVGTVNRVLRGGANNYLGRDVRSALRIGFVPTNKVANMGFRVARTILGAESSGSK